MIAEKRFTDRYIKALKHKDERYEEIEPGNNAIPGSLSIRVEAAPSTRKVFWYLYRGRDEKNKSVSRRLKLGEYPAVTLKDAHRLYLHYASQKAHGKDPARAFAEARMEEKRAKPMSNVIEEYLVREVRGKQASAKNIERMFDKDVSPAIGKMKAGDVGRQDVLAVLDAIRDRGSPVSANRTLGACYRLFQYAIERGYCDTNPTSGIKATSEEPRDRALSPEEVQTLWAKLPQSTMAVPLQFALKFLLITGQRSGEVLGAKWSEIDRERNRWEIPKARVKKRRIQVVPLSSLAIQLLNEIETECGAGGLLFPSPVGETKTYGRKALSVAVRDHLGGLGFEPWVPHDLRRTVATEMAGFGTTQQIIDRVQGRIEGGTGARHYNKYHYLPEKEAALQKWSEWLTTLINNEPKIVSQAAE